MKKIFDAIVDKYKVFLTVFVILALAGAVIMNFVPINYDITDYLPADSSTRLGVGVMNEEFGETNTLNVMFAGLSDEDKTRIYEELSSLENVAGVDYDAESEEYNKDGYSLYTVTIEGNAYSDEAKQVLQEVRDLYQDYEVYLSGTVLDDLSALMLRLIGIASGIVLIILFIMCYSWFEPILFLIPIGMAVLINMGSNILLGGVSSTTQSIAAILQLVLSMDYSIMLTDRYRQEKLKTPDKNVAMKAALKGGFSSITSSSGTTIAGLLCLVLMSFEIGKDMGIVLAKGVFISLICILCVLPGLILTFDKVIERTKKRIFSLNMHKIAAFSYKFRYAVLILFFLLFTGSYFLNGYTKIEFYNSSSNKDEIKTEQIFPPENIIAVLYKNTDEAKIPALAEKIAALPGVEEVNTYAGTLGQQLTSSELAENMDIPEELTDILYYYYFNGKETEGIEPDVFVDFILNDVASSATLGEYISAEDLEQLELLNKFLDKEEAELPRDCSEIASLLDIDEEYVKYIFIYYYGTNGGMESGEMTLAEFISFVQNDIAENEMFASYFDEETLAQIDTLSRFTDKEYISQKQDSASLSAALGIDEDLTEQLLLYYFSVNGGVNSGKMSIGTFVNFLNNDVLTNPQFAGLIDASQTAQLQMLAQFCDKQFIQTPYTSAQTAGILGIDQQMTDQLFYQYFKAAGQTADWTLTLPEFIDFVLTQIAPNESYAAYFDAQTLATLQNAKVLSDAVLSEQMFDSSSLAAVTGMDETIIAQIFAYAGAVNPAGQAVTAMTLPDFLDLVITQIAPNEQFAAYFDEQTLLELNSMKALCDGIKAGTKYDNTQMSMLTGMDETLSEQVYLMYFTAQGKTAAWTMSLYEFTAFVLNLSANNPQYGAYFDDNSLNSMRLLYTVMDSSLQDKTYSYDEMAALLGMESKDIEQLYLYHESLYGDTGDWQLSIYDLISFVVNDVANDESFATAFDAQTLAQLELLQEVMQASLNDEYYSAVELASLLGMNESDIQMLYLYRQSLYGDISAWQMSLRSFVDFVEDNLDNTDDFGVDINIDAASLDQFAQLKEIMDAAAEGKKYTTSQMADLFAAENSSFNASDLDLLYMYYWGLQDTGEQKISVYDFVTFLVNTAMNDELFSAQIDEEMKQELTDAYDLMEYGKENLQAENYSRFTVTTSYGREYDEVYALLEQIYAQLDGELEDYYLLGDSAMAYEMKASFSDEFNFITIVTAITIFIIVAVTFRSFVIPLFLVLLIQCAVFLTMGAAYLQGIGMFYLALIIVQAMLMGATIDYAILYTSYYRDLRRTMGIKEALAGAYDGSIMTILTSSSILCIVTFVVSWFVGDATTSEVCLTISKGAFIADILIIFMLPGMLAALDRFVCKKSKKEKTNTVSMN